MARSQDENTDNSGGGGGSSMTPSTTSSWTKAPLPPGWTQNPDGTISGPGGGQFSNTGSTIKNPWPTGVDPTMALISTLNNGTMGYGDAYVSGFNTQYGLQPGSSLAYYPDNNTYALPSGYAAIGSNGLWGWNPRTGGGNTGAITTQTPISSLANLPQAAPSAALTGGPGTGANAQALFDFLMNRMNTSLVVDPNDPVIKAQTDAYAATQMNNWRNIASAEAEKGGANYNPEATNRSVGEQLSNNVATFQGNLMANELTARRSDIQNAITQSAGLLTAEQQMALEDELTKIDEQLKLTGLNLGESDFLKTLAQRAFEFDTNTQNSVLGGA